MSALPLTATPIEETVATFRSWLHMDDADSLLATLAAVAANNLDGDPVWLLLVGPPGGGKSEILNSLNGLPFTRSAGTITEASLLSGTPKRDVATAANGGLLREIGDFGVIVAKDFGSILSMNRDGRAQVLAALREVYDGSWTRLVGTDGGRALHWTGKVGFVGGVTPTIDRHHAVMGAMGERFMLYRFPEVDADLQARRALSHAGKERRMRKELADSVTAVIQAQSGSEHELSDEEKSLLIALATIVVRARSAVERDNYSREIELVPGSEAPTRLTVALSLLLGGLYSIGVEKQEAWRVLTKVGLDSIPALRLAILETLYAASGDTVSTNGLAGEVRHPATTTRRACEDLVAHGLLECHRQDSGQPHLWELTPFAETRLETVKKGLPETTTDKTGKPRNRLTKPNAEGFPEMSAHAGGVPEMLEDHSYLSSANQIHDKTGTLTNGNGCKTDERPPIDEGTAPDPDDPTVPF